MRECYHTKFHAIAAIHLLELATDTALKAQYQDDFFRFTSPEVVKRIEHDLPRRRSTFDVSVKKLERDLDILLKKKKIDGDISSRVKTLASIARKLKRKSCTLPEMNDLVGMRIVIADMTHLPTVIESIMRKWGNKNTTVQDYVTHPKDTGYQSVHINTRVRGIPVEFQIRDAAMHYAAEEGEAAHRSYKFTSLTEV